MMDLTAWIGTDVDHMPGVSTFDNDGWHDMEALLLLGKEFAMTVPRGLPDDLDILTAAENPVATRSPIGRNLRQLGIPNNGCSQMRRDLSLPASTIQAGIVLRFRKEQAIGPGALHAIVATPGFRNQGCVRAIKRGALEIEEEIRFDP
jgi:hypothetical protein